MPESERNLQQGMFMIRLDMLSETGQVLQSSRRPAILRYRSALFKVIYTLFYMPALLLGSTEEKQTLHIPLFEQFVEYNPTYYIYIEIEAEVAEVYSSALKIHAQFTGLRYMMYYWPVLSLVIGVGSNFFFVTTVAVFIWIRHEMNGSETNGIQQIHASERESVEEIRRAMRQKKMETEKSSGGGIERTDPSTVPAEVLTLSPHRSESSSSYESQEPSSVAEKSSSSDIGIRQRLATTE
nr:seipin isoform X2 [Parasteatoda tepidariorum]